METTATQCCPLANSCSFFLQSKNYLPHISEQLRQQYCLQDNRHCACLRVHNKLGAEWVPLHMMPYHHGWADTLFEQISYSGTALQSAQTFAASENF